MKDGFNSTDSLEVTFDITNVTHNIFNQYPKQSFNRMIFLRLTGSKIVETTDFIAFLKQMITQI